MHSKLKWPAVVSCLLFFASSAAAQFTVSAPSPQPTPFPTPNPQACTSCVATPTAEEVIPVVISYGDGTEARAQVVRGLMEPVGIPANKPVTVTLFLGSGVPSTVVKVGLYDGGQFANVLTGMPNPPPNIVTDTLNQSVTVGADQTVRFNFQAGRTLGLYRVLLTIGPKQYFLRFYAVTTRPTPGIPLPNPPPVQ
jgi:hypothetical protein